MQRSFLRLGLIAFLSLSPIAVFAVPTRITINRVDDGNPAKIKLVKGSKHGVSLTTTGYLVDGSGKKVEGSDFKILSVEEKFCIVSVSLDSTKIDGSWGAILDLP
jgi:hypothetical protein